MRRVVRAILLVAGLLAAILVVDLLAAPPAPFTLAVVRRDGVVIPFVTYAGRKWKGYWPVPGKNREVPLTPADVPGGWWGQVERTAPWDFWPVGGERRPLTIIGTALYYPHCQTNIGLRSDYRSAEPIPPATQHHHPKDGLAIAGATIPVEPITTLNETSPEWADVLRKIGDGFNRAEMAVMGETSRPIATFESGGRMRIVGAVPDLLRSSTPVKVEVMCRSAGRFPGNTIYFFEATRRYGQGVTGLAVFFWGFAHQDVRGRTDAYLYAVPTRGQMADVTYTTPLAMLRVEETPLWVVQRAGHGWEEYAVMDVSKPKPTTVVATFGGGC